MATNPLRCISNPISGVESMEFIIKLGFFRIFDLLLNLNANWNCGVPGAEEPGAGGDRGGVPWQPEPTRFSY
jgi:hypothetical protein